MSGWTVETEWIDGPGRYDMTKRHRIAGPPPFGGLVCDGEEHARAVAQALNRLSGTTERARPRTEPEPHPVADEVDAIQRDAPVSVTSDDDSITVEWTAPDARFGIVLCRNGGGSGWYYASRTESDGGPVETSLDAIQRYLAEADE